MISTWVLSGQLHLLANLSDRNGALTTNELLDQVDDGLLRHLDKVRRNIECNKISQD
jgi:hypothetical protein